MGESQSQLFTGTSMATRAIFPESLIRDKQRVIVPSLLWALLDPTLIIKTSLELCHCFFRTWNIGNDAILGVIISNNSSSTPSPIYYPPPELGWCPSWDIYMMLYRDEENSLWVPMDLYSILRSTITRSVTLRKLPAFTESQIFTIGRVEK